MADTLLNSGKPTRLLAGGLIRAEIGVSEYAVHLLHDSWGSFMSGGDDLIEYSDYDALQTPVVARPRPSEISLNVHSVSPAAAADSLWYVLDRPHVSGEVFEVDVMEFHIPTSARGTAGLIYTFNNLYVVPGSLRYQPGDPDQVQVQLRSRDSRPTQSAYGA